MLVVVGLPLAHAPPVIPPRATRVLLGLVWGEETEVDPEVGLDGLLERDVGDLVQLVAMPPVVTFRADEGAKLAVFGVGVQAPKANGFLNGLPAVVLGTSRCLVTIVALSHQTQLFQHVKINKSKFCLLPFPLIRDCLLLFPLIRDCLLLFPLIRDC